MKPNLYHIAAIILLFVMLILVYEFSVSWAWLIVPVIVLFLIGMPNDLPEVHDAEKELDDWINHN